MSLIGDIIGSVEKLLVNGTALSGGIGASINKSASGTNHIIPGDVDIVDILLISEDQSRSYSLMEQCKNINIFESILSPSVYMVLGIADGVGLLQKFPILGEEYVSIKFKTPSSANTTNYMMRVNRITNKRIVGNQTMVTYDLECVSAEIFRNASKLVTKKYEANISDTVKNILTKELVTEKKITVESTKDIDKSLITRMQPLKAIDYLRQRAVSKSSVSSSYVFFENKHGYNFVTIEKMMADGAKQASGANFDKVFFLDNASTNVDSKNLTIRNILAYKQVSFADSVSKIQNGGITNVTKQFDMLTGDIKEITYTNNEGQDKMKTADQNGASMNSTNFDRNHGKTTAVYRMIPYNSIDSENSIAEKNTFLHSYIQKITQNMVQILVYGDTNLAVGDIITCHFPRATGMENDIGLNSRLDSGNYLVSKLRHIIINSSRPQHTISMELIKGNITA